MNDSTNECRVEFNDITLIESEGHFDKTQDIMNKDQASSNSWMLMSDVYLFSEAGLAFFVLHFYHNKIIYIEKYESSSGTDMMYNSDIMQLSSWVKNRGWISIRPLPDLVRNDIEFWKFFWETHVIDSDFLVQLFGKREDDMESDIGE